MTNDSFAQLFSDALDVRGVSPGEAARELDRMGLKIHRGTLSRWRNGETVPGTDKINVLRALPDALGMSPAEKATFLRAAGATLGFPLIRAGRSVAPAIPQRIHFGAGDLPPFAGRAAEMAELRRLVLNRRPVLITGLGGVGKTRLAQELLRACAGHFPHGCEFLTLAAGQSSAQVLRNVAHLLGIDLPAGSFDRDGHILPGRLRERLQGIDLLFLIDNLENAAQAHDLLRELPGVTWVFTARRVSLKRAGVHLVHLDMPPIGDAVAMFQAHAEAHAGAHFRPAVARGQPNDDRVTGIVEKIGRLPIAIRLVSAQLANGVVASATEMEAWLDGGGLLRGGSHSANLRRLFDQMLGSLPAEAQAAFEVCGAFATRDIRLNNLMGVCRRAGIQATPDVWLTLADFSLIDLPDENQVTLHQLLHDYARLRLRAGSHYDTVRASYEAHYLDLCRAAGDRIEEPDRDYWRLLPEEADLRAVAEGFIVAGDWPRLKAIWPILTGYLWNTGDHAGYEAFDRLSLSAAEATADDDWAAIILSELGFVAMGRGDWHAAGDLFGRSQAIHDARPDQRIEQTRLRRYRASLALRQGRPEDALDLLDECAARLATLTNPPEARLDVALMLMQGVFMSAWHRLGDLQRAATAGMAAERLFMARQSSGRGHRLAEYRLELGDILYRNGDTHAARRMWAAMLDEREGLRHLAGHAEAQLRLAWLDGEGPVAAMATVEEARYTLLIHGLPARAETAASLIARLAAGEPLPPFEELIAGCGYLDY